MADSEEQAHSTAEKDEPKTSEPTSPTLTEKKKIDLLLKAAGDAPIMKKKKWAVDPSKKVGWVTEFIKKYIKCEPHESVFIYVNQSFSPAPDRDLKSLFECFGSDGKLILHYCKSQAWG
ncbi:ubiquitin-like protein ATG12 [Ptychodera flava]|uniref:ubiquitin-like protein ATG12 n=1 Tax=Ptychodera flava TaxID=63121 RepID=UPI00396A5821